MYFDQYFILLETNVQFDKKFMTLPKGAFGDKPIKSFEYSI